MPYAQTKIENALLEFRQVVSSSPAASAIVFIRFLPTFQGVQKDDMYKVE